MPETIDVTSARYAWLFTNPQQLLLEKPMFVPVTGRPLRRMLAFARGFVELVGPCQYKYALLTGPVTSPSADDLPTDAWRFLPLGLELLARECVDDDALVETFGYGNRVSAIAFLMGLAREDLRAKDLEPYDPLCPLIAALRITKAGGPEHESRVDR